MAISVSMSAIVFHQQIADVFYQMQIDSITEPIRFNYGYHIFKLTEKKALPSFEEIQKDLKNQYQQVRYQYEYKKYVQGLKVITWCRY